MKTPPRVSVLTSSPPASNEQVMALRGLYEAMAKNRTNLGAVVGRYEGVLVEGSDKYGWPLTLPLRPAALPYPMSQSRQLTISFCCWRAANTQTTYFPPDLPSICFPSNL